QRTRLADEMLGARLGDIAAADTLAVAELHAFGVEEQVELLRLWLAARGHPAPRRSALQEFLRQLAASDDRVPLLDLGQARLRRYQGRIHLARQMPALASVYPVAAPGEVRLPHGVLRLVADPDGFGPTGELQVRFRHGGERLLTRGRHRALKQLFQEACVPPWLRAGYPLLYDALGVVAVPGLAHRDPPSAGGAAESGRWRAQWQPQAP
ncbi:MAG: tRNA lysidine(34) synthetase TilS, partial [Pseudomonadales bacterium]